MKGNTVLWIAGGIMIVGAAAYGIYKFLRHRENKAAEPTDTSAASPGRIILPDAVSDNPQRGRIAMDFERAQQDTAASIKERHQTAAQQLREILGEMNKDSAEFKEKITQVNDDLDKLL